MNKKILTTLIALLLILLILTFGCTNSTPICADGSIVDGITIFKCPTNNDTNNETPPVDFKWDIDTVSNLPIIIFDTQGQKIVDEPKIKASMTVLDGATNKVTDTGTIINTGIELRGFSSLSFPKKSYGVETRNALEEDLDVSLLGFPEEADWVFYAPYLDKSFARNNLAYKLSSDMGHYASQPKYLEVFVKDRNQDITDSYNGIYALIEKVKRGKNRVAIAKMEETCTSGACLSGGYILSIDRSSDDPAFTTTQGTKLIIEYPKNDKINSAQTTWITNYMNEFETAMAGPNFNDPVNGYAKYINVDSFVDYLLLAELGKHYDGFGKNFFMSKDNSGKLTAGPIWDLDRAFGNTYMFNSDQIEGFVIDINFDDRHAAPFWWKKLLEDPAFKSKMITRWNSLRQNIFSKENINTKIDSFASQVESAQERNFAKWGLDNFNYHNQNTGFVEEVHILKDWISDRIDWLDIAINRLLIVDDWPNPISSDGSNLPAKLVLKSNPIDINVGGNIQTIDFGGEYSRSYDTTTLPNIAHSFYSKYENNHTMTLEYTFSDPGFGEKQWNLIYPLTDYYLVLLAEQNATSSAGIASGPFNADWSNTTVQLTNTNTGNYTIIDTVNYQDVFDEGYMSD